MQEMKASIRVRVSQRGGRAVHGTEHGAYIHTGYVNGGRREKFRTYKYLLVLPMPGKHTSMGLQNLQPGQNPHSHNQQPADPQSSAERRWGCKVASVFVSQESASALPTPSYPHPTPHTALSSSVQFRQDGPGRIPPAPVLASGCPTWCPGLSGYMYSDWFALGLAFSCMRSLKDCRKLSSSRFLLSVRACVLTTMFAFDGASPGATSARGTQKVCSQDSETEPRGASQSSVPSSGVCLRVLLHPVVGGCTP